ncbi:hypothetical protein [Aquicoccus sp. SU-CL01552]|uniref:hypothetical protein n=1 Tax=Aquicoccus sp. SU-CL01552 TaxID=3127656 RepID=UPI003106E42D
MPLSDAEITWIGFVAKRDLAVEMAAAEQRAAQKKAFLEDQLGASLAATHDEIDRAMGLVIENREDPGAVKSLWLSLTGQEVGTDNIPWRATDDELAESGLGKWAMRMDLEVDTREDIGQSTMEIPPEKAAAILQAHQRILALQAHMENQLDDNGERLFSDEDIRKELWTPLMREGLIPENMIPDKCSEQAIAFQGAMDFYGDKLAAYSETHSKGMDKFKTGMRIAKEVVTVTGAIVSNSITISNATTVADKNSDIKSLKKEDADLKTELDGTPPPSQDRITEINERRDAIKTQSKTLTDQVTQMQNETKYAQNATAILLGGLSGTELVVDHVASKEPDPLVKWCNTIEGALSITQTLAGKTVDTAMRGNGASSGMITCVSAAITASFAGVKMVPTLILAVKEPDDIKRAKLIDKLIGNLAETVASSITSVAGRVTDEAGSTEDSTEKQKLKDQAAALSQVASALKLAITQVGKGPAVLQAIKTGNKAELAMLLGGAAIAAAFGASSEAIYDGVREDAASREIMDMDSGEALFHEGTGAGQEAGQDAGSAVSMAAITSALDQMDKPALAGLKASASDPLAGTSAEELAQQIEQQAEDNARQQAERELAEAFTPEAIEEMMKEADQELVGFEELYSQAHPDGDITQRTAEEIVQAQQAIDRAMANTAALRQKVALINGLTATGAGVLAALVPGTGAVVAAQKVAKDIYVLKKCVDTHNAWVDSMEVAFAAQSGVAAAVQNTLKNSRIHLDHAKVSLVLHTAQAGAAVAQVMDPTGASSIVSASLSMADAVVEFGYKMHGERAISVGWSAYKDARDNPGNRKRARKALRLNSTLAKCCIAYGASIMGDPSAQQAMRASGLTVAALQNDKDICVKLITYLETELTDDPTVLRVVNTKDSKWHPGRPELTLTSWMTFKGAAARSAEPLLAPESTKTPGLDRLLTELGKLDSWQDKSAIELARSNYEKLTVAAPDTPFPALFADLLSANREAYELLQRADTAFSAYAPLSAASSVAPHEGMAQIGASFATLARLNSATVAANIDALEGYIALHAAG